MLKFILLLAIGIARSEGEVNMPCKSGSTSCSEKDVIDESDFKWTMEHSFKKYLSKAPSNKLVEVDHIHGLYIESKIDAQKDVQLQTSSKYERCRNVFLRTNTGSVTKYEVLDIKIKNIIKFGKNDYNIFIAVFDPDCVIYVDREDVHTSAEYYHSFPRNMKVDDLPEKIDDKKKRGKFEYMGANEVVAKNQKSSNRYNVRSIEGFTPINCFHLCQNGKAITLQLTENQPFAHIFKFQSTCEWFNIYMPDRIDLANEQTKEDTSGVEISLRHGFVIFKEELRANVLDFHSIDRKGYEVTVTFSSDRGKASMIVANSHGQAAKASIHRGYKDTIEFFFSKDDCLTNSISDKDVQNAFKQGRNLGLLVVKKDPLISFAYVNNGEKDAEKQRLKDSFDNEKMILEQKNTEIDNAAQIESGGVDEDNNVDEVDAPPELDEEEPDEQATVSIQTHTTVRTGESVSVSLKEVIKARNERLRKAMDFPGYSTWAIPAGFAVGSFISFIICNILLAIFSRTIFVVWYKAMYKKYGSATTVGAGTTMGKTGGGETIGATTGTTVGSTTMGGETTSADQTGGTTAA